VAESRSIDGAGTLHISPVVAATFTTCMEQLQEGYVGSIAATAGCLMIPVSRDYYGMDVMFVRVGSAEQEEVSLYAQLKSTTTRKPDPNQEHFSFRFKRREHMQRLANPRKGIKAILIVMATHPNQRLWSAGDHESLSLLHCCYWATLEGETIPAGVDSPTIRVRTANIFTAEALSEMLDRLERGEQLHG
jgi:hypothetical protein